ncbi:hypothetical protein ACHAW6_000176 [Cyclotella cf. meneghiniana]
MPKKRETSTRLHALTIAGISPIFSTLLMAWPLRMRKRPGNALHGYLPRSGAAHTQAWLVSFSQG